MRLYTYQITTIVVLESQDSSLEEVKLRAQINAERIKPKGASSVIVKVRRVPSRIKGRPSKLSDEDREEIRRLRRKNTPIAQLSAMFKVSRDTIFRVEK